jgi:muramoyltetrapeptide carboxypeptidase
MIEQQIRKPKAVKKGDTIGVFSPSEPIVDTRVDRLKSGVELLEKLGFNVVLAPGLYNHHFYMAGTIEERAKDFNNFINDKNIKMIMTSWGGKSSNQLLELIDYDALNSNPKLICGFSDPTSFLNSIFTKTSIPTLYGPDVVGKLVEDPEDDIKRFISLISKGERLVYYGNEKNNSATIKGGQAKGTLLGGNLSSFMIGLLGTQFQPNLDGAILFFEAGSPKPGDIHQMLTYLRHYGVFNKIAGLIVGNIGGVEKRKWAKRPLIDIIKEETKNYDFPVVSMPIFGHFDCPKASIPIGIPAMLDADTLTLTLATSLVK